eukprot:TRINITY_DN59719_c0_g2_i1.p1 TRINITY_DN59719_c0_g2~~TRINITY_DN59719_c0_g2_i1.p1  ORF type:complete len:313 (+),score=38.33 TRINITY_DN59719_c0_g2_i1:37-939(+)
MAGKACVLLESAVYWPGCVYLGSDIDSGQLADAAENLAYARDRGVLRAGAVEILRCTCGRLPLAAESVDVVLCDLPYGRQYGSEEANRALYAAALKEVSRVLRSTCGRAVLITTSTEGNDSAMEEAVANCGLRLVAAESFRFGGHKARVRCRMYCLLKTHAPAEDCAASERSTAALFDLSFFGSADDAQTAVDREISFADWKPLLQLYVPPKAAEGRPKEKPNVPSTTTTTTAALASSAKAADRNATGRRSSREQEELCCGGLKLLRQSLSIRYRRSLPRTSCSSSLLRKVRSILCGQLS